MTVDQRNYIDNAPTAHLVGGIHNATTGPFGLDSLIGFPTSRPYVVTIDMGTASAEQILITDTTGSTVNTCVRNYNGQGAFSHPNNATVNHTTVSKDYQEANDHHRATSNVHGITGALVDTGTAQTLSNKTLTGSPSVTADAFVGTPTADGNAVYTGKNAAGVTKFTVLGTGDVTAVGVSAATVTTSGDVTVGGDETITGTLGVTGATTVAGLTAGATQVSTLTTTSDATVDGNLDVVGPTHLEGTATLDSTLNVGGATTLQGVTATTVHATGAVTADAGATITGAVGITGTTTVTGDANVSGTLTANAISVGGHDLVSYYLSDVDDTTIGTAATGFSQAGSELVTVLGGHLIWLRLALNITANITQTAGNVTPDKKCFTLNNSAWFPASQISFEWSDGIESGDCIINTDGTIDVRTASDSASGGAGLVLRGEAVWFV